MLCLRRRPLGQFRHWQGPSARITRSMFHLMAPTYVFPWLSRPSRKLPLFVLGQDRPPEELALIVYPERGGGPGR